MPSMQLLLQASEVGRPITGLRARFLCELDSFDLEEPATYLFIVSEARTGKCWLSGPSAVTVSCPHFDCFWSVHRKSQSP